ncbi:AraC family transcriptional regulator [Vibrio sp. HN007]|uniref:AraC family transcriptional regulator n=1 Tax=Vibrio iocasae TaxID=3098914 RepID=UPI0035D48A37
MDAISELKPALFNNELSTIKVRLLKDVCLSYGRKTTAPAINSHDHCLVYITEGNGYHYIDGRSTYCKPGTLLILTKYQVHRFMEVKSWDGIVVYYSEKDLITKDNLTASNMLKRSIRQLDVIYNVNELIESDLTSLYREGLNQSDSLSLTLQKNILQNILYKCILRSDNVCVQVEPENDMELFSSFIDMVEERCTEEHNLNFYLEALDVSRKKLNALCRKYEDTTGKKLIDKYLLSDIKHQLVYSNDPISVISVNTGFSESTNLSKFFRKYTGISPREFRRSFYVRSAA